MRTPGIAAPASRMRVLAYTRTDLFEEDDVTVDHAAELVEKYLVTWLDVEGTRAVTAGGHPSPKTSTARTACDRAVSLRP